MQIISTKESDLLSAATSRATLSWMRYYWNISNVFIVFGIYGMNTLHPNAKHISYQLQGIQAWHDWMLGWGLDMFESVRYFKVFGGIFIRVQHVNSAHLNSLYTNFVDNQWNEWTDGEVGPSACEQVHARHEYACVQCLHTHIKIDKYMYTCIQVYIFIYA